MQVLPEELQYLGHLVTENGISTDPEKVAAIRNLEPPTNVRELRRCLGTALWYRRFISVYSEVIQPLSQLLKKKTRWNWGKGQQDSFDELKRRLTQAPVLACPDFNQRFTVQTDASNVVLGAVLTQTGRV